MKPFRRLVALAVLVALVPAAALRAQTVAGAPTTIDYQGKALDAAGAVLAPTTPANYEMRFRIYDAQEGGATIWSEIQIVTVSKGMFSVRLGEGTANGSEPRPALSEAFNGSARFLGVTIVITGQTPVEILPRLAFLASPFAYVANRSKTAESLVLNPSTTAPTSSLNVAQLSYSTQSVTASGTTTSITLTDQNHTAIINASSGALTVNLPGVTTPREYFITKTDSSANIVSVSPPSGGTINGSTSSIKLKVLGESVAIQNVGGTEWWVVSDTRDKTPVGTIISLASNTAPAGYLRCDGTSYSRTAARAVDLFAAIGTAWGAADASTFRVPDLRGVFLRGLDAGAQRDPDRNSRTIWNTGGSAGDAVGSYQVDAYASHNHTFSASTTTSSAGTHNHKTGSSSGVKNGEYGMIKRSDGGGNTGTGFDSSTGEPDIKNAPIGITFDGEHTHTVSISGTSGSSGSNETRPKNVNVGYFIKY